jgi:hypothetical protein
MFRHNIPQDKIKELETFGFTKIGFLDKNNLRELKEETEAFLKEAKVRCPDHELFNLINSDLETKLGSNKIVENYLNPFLQQVFDESKVDIYPVSHIIKPFGRNSAIWHQDSSIVDERINFSLNAWMPFVDSSKLNGCMWFLPGSHISTVFFRQFGFNPYVGKLLKQIKPLLQPIKVKAGEIVLFHRNIIHGSSVNFLPKNRIAIESVIVNKGAQLYNFHREEAFVKNKILGYKVDIHHFLRQSPKDDFYNQVYNYELFEDLGMDGITRKIKKELTTYIDHSRQAY